MHMSEGGESFADSLGCEVAVLKQSRHARGVILHFRILFRAQAVEDIV